MSLVLELQSIALEGKISASELLRKALYVSRKLKEQEFETWVLDELNGYKGNHDAIHEYRKITGVFKLKNNIGVFLTAQLDDPKITKKLTERKLDISIYEMEHLLDNHKADDLIIMHFLPEAVAQLKKSLNTTAEPATYIPISQIHKIIETVKEIVLHWTIQLEADGVLGEGMSFTKKDAENEGKTTEKVTNNFYNAEGGNFQIQQNTTNSTQINTINSKIDMNALQELISSVKQLVDEVDDQDIKAELNAEVAVLEVQTKSPKPKLSIITETLKSIRSVAEGITGSLIASGVQSQVFAFLSQLAG